MTAGYRQISLGSEALAYLRRQLSQGNTLAHCLLQRKDLAQGKMTTYLPRYVDAETARYQFKEGILREPSPRHHRRILSLDGSVSTLVPKGSMETYLIRTLKQTLSNREESCCLFENVEVRAGDPWLSSTDALLPVAWKYGSEVYFMFTKKTATIHVIRHAIRVANACWYFLGIVAAQPKRRLPNGTHELTKARLKELAQQTERIIVGAYDGEGYLIWKRPERS